MLVGIATFGLAGWGANIFTIPADIVPHGWVGTVDGISAFGGGLGSIIFMQITGLLVDLQRSFDTVFLVAGFVPVFAAIIVQTVIGKIKQIDVTVSLSLPGLTYNARTNSKS